MSSSVSFARDSAEPPTVPSNTSRFFSWTAHGNASASHKRRSTLGTDAGEPLKPQPFMV